MEAQKLGRFQGALQKVKGGEGCRVTGTHKEVVSGMGGETAVRAQRRDGGVYSSPIGSEQD